MTEEELQAVVAGARAGGGRSGGAGGGAASEGAAGAPSAAARASHPAPQQQLEQPDSTLRPGDELQLPGQRVVFLGTGSNCLPEPSAQEDTVRRLVAGLERAAAEEAAEAAAAADAGRREVAQMQQRPLRTAAAPQPTAVGGESAGSAVATATGALRAAFARQSEALVRANEWAAKGGEGGEDAVAAAAERLGKVAGALAALRLLGGSSN